MEEVFGHGLTGDIACSSPLKLQVIEELKDLMMRHKIDKIDIGWAGPWNEPGKDEDRNYYGELDKSDDALM